MSRQNDFRVFLNQICDYQIIPANSGRKPPEFPYITLQSIAEIDTQVNNIARETIDAGSISMVEETFEKRFENNLQFDCFSNSEEEAIDIIQDFRDKILTIYRREINQEGFGILEDTLTDVENRTGLEFDSQLYRFQFDLTIDYNKLINRQVANLTMITVTLLNDGTSFLVQRDWILEEGIWNDYGAWDDADVWVD